jgi:hypothetical protein
MPRSQRVGNVIFRLHCRPFAGLLCQFAGSDVVASFPEILQSLFDNCIQAHDMVMLLNAEQTLR